MPRQRVPFATADLSTFAKALRSQRAARATPSTHVELLNMLARAAGHRNVQHLRAVALAPATVPEPSPAPRAEADTAAVVARTARHVDAEGRLRTWPARTSSQHLCLRVFWSRIPRGEPFDDPAIIRRTLCALGLTTRTRDGREYRRVPAHRVPVPAREQPPRASPSPS